MLDSPLYDEYWRFAAERHATYLRRLQQPRVPWTDNPVLQNFRFTNAYRAADRTSQYLIRHVQYRKDRSQAPAEVFFRTLLFKIFNKIDTWELLEARLGELSWMDTPLSAIAGVLDEALRSRIAIYSAAYIMSSPPFGEQRKHQNHLKLLSRMMTDRVWKQIADVKCIKSMYRILVSYPGLGSFLAFQYAIDLNYSSIGGHSESSFVVAGPGALDGLSKCVSSGFSRRAEILIQEMTERQEQEFQRLGISFDGLFGRRLHPIDIQNLWCEFSKLTRVTHPDIKGVAGRTRIKQRYTPLSRPMDLPMFPPSWGIVVPTGLAVSGRRIGQTELF